MAAPKGNKFAKDNEGGAPSKYQETYPGLVKEHLAEGFSLTSFAGEIGVTPQTLHNWSKSHQEFFDAIKIGRAKGQKLWELRLLKLAMDGGGNATAVIFAMKNLYQDDWREKSHVEAEVKVEDTTGAKDKLAHLIAKGAAGQSTTGDTGEAE